MRQFYAARGPRRSTLLVVILLVTLGLAGALTHQALDAAASHRASVERALRDYASIAAWDYSLYVREHLYSVLTASFRPLEKVEAGDPSAPLPPPTILAGSTREAARCETPARDAARFYFRMSLRDGSLVTSGAAVAPSVRDWIQRVVPSYVRSAYGTDWIYAHLYGVAGGRHHSLAFSVLRDPRGAPVAVYGFESCMTAWGRSIFQLVMEETELLPPSLTGGLPNDSLFSVVVTDELGRPIYASSRQYPRTYTASYQLGGGQGGVTTWVSLSPAAADRLVIGGMPRSRMAFLLGLLALTAGLIGIALVQLRRENELARLRADFISSVSHELRTPLAQIRMFAETLLLDRVRSDDERTRSLQIIDQEARRLTHLVTNVLQFSRAERRGTRLKLERSDLAAEVREAIEAFAPVAQARRVELRTALESGVDAPVDRFALRQVLLNLLDNAVKYGPHGQTVEVKLSRRDGHARLTVADQGSGIGARDRQRIWEPFFRREGDANSAVAGSGIGLAVVRELVTLHGGRAWVEKAPGGGARFVVELPGARGRGRGPGAASSTGANRRSPTADVLP